MEAEGRSGPEEHLQSPIRRSSHAATRPLSSDAAAPVGRPVPSTPVRTVLRRALYDGLAARRPPYR